MWGPHRQPIAAEKKLHGEECDTLHLYSAEVKDEGILTPLIVHLPSCLAQSHLYRMLCVALRCDVQM
jgi:hypothetical protein